MLTPKKLEKLNNPSQKIINKPTESDWKNYYEFKLK